MNKYPVPTFKKEMEHSTIKENRFWYEMDTDSCPAFDWLMAFH